MSKKHSQQTGRSLVFTMASNAKLFAIALALSLPSLLSGAPVGVVPGRLLVKPSDRVNETALQQLFAAQGAQEQSAIAQINLRVLHVPEDKLPVVLEALSHNPNIEFAEPDYIVGPDTLPPSPVPNDTYYSFEWHLTKIGAPTAWQTTAGASNVIVAILDSGVEATHPDLASQLVPGWNFMDNNADTSDVRGHGTGVAGTVAAASYNGTGVASVAWGCRLMPIRIADTNGYGYASAMSSGLVWAADHGSRVANISYGNVSAMSSVNTAAQYFQSKGGVVTISAGNEATFDSTADNPLFLMVSATDSTDTLASWSNKGNNVDVSAPGVNIVTTGLNATYGYASGTSFSAPIVAAVAALILSANPSLTPAQVQDIIRTSADDLGTPGFDTSYGWGRVNASKALTAAGGPPPTDTATPTATITAPSAAATVSGSASISVSASDNVGVTRVECYINGTLAGTSSTTPASFTWNTTTYPNGSYTLLARAYDAAGNVGLSSSVTVSVQNTVADITAPTATITAPTAGSVLAGAVTVNVSSGDDIGVTRVECYLNGVLVGTASTALASFSLDTRTYANGSYTLQARAYDAAGNAGTSASVSVSIQNAVVDVTPPAVQITSPTDGATISGRSTKVYVTASDNVAVTRVELLVDGKLYSKSTSSTPVFSWSTSKLARGFHTLQAVAYDAAGNSTRSSIVNVRK